MSEESLPYYSININSAVLFRSRARKENRAKGNKEANNSRGNQEYDKSSGRAGCEGSGGKMGTPSRGRTTIQLKQVDGRGRKRERGHTVLLYGIVVR